MLKKSLRFNFTQNVNSEIKISDNAYTFTNFIKYFIVEILNYSDFTIVEFNP